jgi:3-oxoacid CoA-transferase subunit B
LSVNGGKLKGCSVVDIDVVPGIVIDPAVIEVGDKGLLLKEVAPGWTAEEIQELTEPRLIIAPDLKEIELM